MPYQEESRDNDEALPRGMHSPGGVGAAAGGYPRLVKQQTNRRRVRRAERWTARLVSCTHL